MGRDFDYDGKLMSKRIDSSVFPGNQGGPLEHIIAAKAVCFYEAMQPDFIDYQIQVVKNAKVLSLELIKLGYKIVSGGTDNHEFLVDLRSKFLKMTGKQAEEALGRHQITVNKNMVSGDSRRPNETSGLRLGTPYVTTRGMKEAEMVQIANLIDKILTEENHEICSRE